MKMRTTNTASSGSSSNNSSSRLLTRRLVWTARHSHREFTIIILIRVRSHTMSACYCHLLVTWRSDSVVRRMNEVTLLNRILHNDGDRSKRIRISQFRFIDVKWQYTGYILCKYGEDWSSNPGDYESRNSITFSTIWQNLAYSTKYLRTWWTDLHHRFRICRPLHKLMTVTKLTFVLWSPKGRCYGNELIWRGRVCRRQNWSSLLFALAFYEELQYHYAVRCINSSDNVAIHYAKNRWSLVQ